MARYGRVTFTRSYVVDLANEEMVDDAKELLAEDIANIVRDDAVIDYIGTTEAPEATKADINDLLWQNDKERWSHRST